MLNILIFGAPGSGKGTQAPKLVEKYGLVHISTGDLFRFEMSNNTPLGMKAKEFIAKGELVPDEVTFGMLKNKVESVEETNGFIFDGFPRTIPQAMMLDAYLKEKGTSVTLLVELLVPQEELERRLLLRGESSGRADDKDIDIIRNRLQVYANETSAVSGHYSLENKSFTIKGVGEIDEIFDRICGVIGERQS